MAVVRGKGSKHQGRTHRLSPRIHTPMWEKGGGIWDCPSSPERRQGSESVVQERPWKGENKAV